MAPSTQRRLGWMRLISLVALGTAMVDAASVQPSGFVNNVTLNGVTYNYQRLVGFGSFPGNVTDAFGDTIGGVGSAIAVRPGSFRRLADGTYTGTLAAQPDRGHNSGGASTVDYAARLQYFDFVLDPYFRDTPGGAGSVTLAYRGGLQYSDPNAPGGAGPTTGLDPSGVRPATGAFPQLPIGSNGRLSVDAEGLAYSPSGFLWVSDEYGPYIYRVGLDGTILSAIQPPRAITPITKGALNFTALADPTTGRVANQGFESLTLSADGNRLYAALQSGTVQDGGSDSFTGPYTRILGYDVRNPAAPVLREEYVLQLPPKGSKGEGYAQSEIAYVKDGLFLVLSRDGKGLGNGPKTGDMTSAFKNIGLVDVTKATNIAGGAYDSPSTPVAPKAKLVSSVTPATFTSFISLIDSRQLGRFGLHNGLPFDGALDGKFESLAIASVLEPERPNDYFVFAMSDNDFITQNGVSGGVPYNDTSAGVVDVTTQLLVFRVTLPGAQVNAQIYAS